MGRAVCVPQNGNIMEDILVPLSTGGTVGEDALAWIPALLAFAAWPITGFRPQFGGLGWQSLALGISIPLMTVLGYLGLWCVGLLHPVWRIDMGSAPVALLIVTFLALGEEICWRGFMLPLLRRSLNFWSANAIVAATWFAAHLPVILSGSYGPIGVPRLYALFWFAVNISLFSFAIGALWEITRDVWMPTIAHGLWNVVVQDCMSNVFANDSLMAVGEFAYGPSVGLVVALGVALWASRNTRLGYGRSALDRIASNPGV
jgi:membrane protease YdiL (CAAX protease family)